MIIDKKMLLNYKQQENNIQSNLECFCGSCTNYTKEQENLCAISICQPLGADIYSKWNSFSYTKNNKIHRPYSSGSEQLFLKHNHYIKSHCN